MLFPTGIFILIIRCGKKGIHILQVDPDLLRSLTQHFMDGAEQLRKKADHFESTSVTILEGSSGWKGTGAQGFEKRKEVLLSEFRKASRQLSEMASVLRTLATQIENIQYKQRELERLQHEVQALHGGWNLKNDAEIAYLEGRIFALSGEIETESFFADRAASAAFEAIRSEETIHELLSHITQVATTVAKGTEEVWDEYVKPAGEWLLNGVEEFLDIPEMIDAWHDLTNPNLSMGARLLAAGKIIAYGALDVSMLFGVGDLAKGVQLLAKFGAKYGAKLIMAEGRKEVTQAITKGLSEFADGVKSGAENFFDRGSPVAVGVGTLGSGAGVLTGFARYNKAADKIVRFSGKIGGKVAEDLKMSRKRVPEPDHIVPGEYRLKPNCKYTANGYDYETDELGRIKVAKGELRIDIGKRNLKHQIKVGLDDRLEGDHGGHLFAHIFGGSGMVDNMVPMNGRLLNQGEYKRVENLWKSALEQNKQVFVNVKPVFSGESTRPIAFKIEYQIDGVTKKIRLENP